MLVRKGVHESLVHATTQQPPFNLGFAFSISDSRLVISSTSFEFPQSISSNRLSRLTTVDLGSLSGLVLAEGVLLGLGGPLRGLDDALVGDLGELIGDFPFG